MEPQRTECAVLGLLLLAAQTIGAEQNATKGCNLPKIPLRITIWNFPPYVIVQNDSRSDPKLSGISLEFFWKLVEKCYKNCSKEVFQVNTVDSDEELIEAFETNATDIAFPITRQLKIELKDRLVHTSAGLTFQPLTVSQGYLYVVDAENQREQFLENAITSLFDDTWPMIVLILLLGGIAGSLVWLLDHPGNREEFPRSFTKGTYEGWWWAFVSMTTVGYGDKTPKSICGRAFGVIWILLGLVVIAMFTATATNAITASSSMGDGIAGYNIGVLSRTEASLSAARYGAHVKANYSNFEALGKALKEGDIDGILMDVVLVSHHLNELHESEFDFRVKKQLAASIPYYIGWPKRLAFGTDGQGQESCFLEELAEMETGILEKKYLKQVKAFRDGTDLQGILNGHNPWTTKFLLILFAVFAGVMTCGVAGELCYKKSKVFTRKTHGTRTADTEKPVDVKMTEFSSEQFREMDQKLAAMITEMQLLRGRINKLERGLEPSRLTHLSEADTRL